MPVKLFEYISYQKPIIAVEGTAVGKFVKNNDIGWVIPYDTEALTKLLKKLQEKKTEIIEKQKNIKRILTKNTWEARALQIIETLK
jgi:glycosyltransferase involved in cell wall biosynthesis